MAATAAPFPIEETTIATLHAAYVSGRATAISVCQAHLDRIVAYDRKGPALGAIKGFPDLAHDDEVDACSGALEMLNPQMKSWGIFELYRQQAEQLRADRGI